jgi:hypothetical protein
VAFSPLEVYIISGVFENAISQRQEIYFFLESVSLGPFSSCILIAEIRTVEISGAFGFATALDYDCPKLFV